jgi:hypothetical protein
VTAGSQSRVFGAIQYRTQWKMKSKAQLTTMWDKMKHGLSGKDDEGDEELLKTCAAILGFAKAHEILFPPETEEVIE